MEITRAVGYVRVTMRQELEATIAFMMSSMPKVQHTWICRNYMIDLKSTCLEGCFCIGCRMWQRPG
ncbi:MAG: hypothetical protein ACLR1V_18340 [Coprococcus sp.]